MHAEPTLSISQRLSLVLYPSTCEPPSSMPALRAPRPAFGGCQRSVHFLFAIGAPRLLFAELQPPASQLPDVLLEPLSRCLLAAECRLGPGFLERLVLSASELLASCLPVSSRQVSWPLDSWPLSSWRRFWPMASSAGFLVVGVLLAWQLSSWLPVSWLLVFAAGFWSLSSWLPVSWPLLLYCWFLGRRCLGRWLLAAGFLAAGSLLAGRRRFLGRRLLGRRLLRRWFLGRGFWLLAWPLASWLPGSWLPAFGCWLLGFLARIALTVPRSDGCRFHRIKSELACTRSLDGISSSWRGYRWSRCGYESAPFGHSKCPQP